MRGLRPGGARLPGVSLAVHCQPQTAAQRPRSTNGLAAPSLRCVDTLAPASVLTSPRRTGHRAKELGRTDVYMESERAVLIVHFVFKTCIMNVGACPQVPVAGTLYLGMWQARRYNEKVQEIQVQGLGYRV